MNKAGLFLSVALCLGLCGSAALASEADLTVGDFAIGLAEMVTGRPDYNPEDAARMLRGMGYDLNADLRAGLTEGEFIDLLQLYGIELASANPDQLVSHSTADAVFGLLGSQDTMFTENHSGNNSIKCKDGVNKGDHCLVDSDCPGSFCNIPPGQAKKLASPIDP